MTAIITPNTKYGNLYNNAPSQLRRFVGLYESTFVGERCGTVQDERGKSWDWWETDEMLDATFPKIKIVPAR